jgi:hypothetical protein
MAAAHEALESGARDRVDHIMDLQDEADRA